MTTQGHFGGDIERVVDLLGGEKTIGVSIGTSIEAHDVLSQGLPAAALLALIDTVGFLGEGDSLKTSFGLSLRTLRHRCGSGGPQPLGVEQSNQVWNFARIFARVVDVLESKAEAARWMNSAATGLSNRKPVDLLGTPAGSRAVETYLTRIETGVYT